MPTALSLDWNAVRADFPILGQTVNGRRLAYLDNAATTQKPQCVIDTLVNYYQTSNANIHRGVHLLSQRATDSYEQARVTARRFLNAASPEEIIFLRGTTEAINLVASTYGAQTVRSGDEIVITEMEHHSNIVPWQMLCEKSGAVLRVVPVTDAGELDVAQYERMLSSKTRIVSVVHVSNALGTVNPVRRIAKLAHQAGAIVVVDGAQAAPHGRINVRDLDCDFYAFSSHKVYGPTGAGVLYGRRRLLEEMPPYQGGGDMIRSVSFEKTTYNSLPHKFEAGTPNIAGVIGMGRALEYVEQLGIDAIAAHEHELLRYATERLADIPGIRMIGEAAEKAAVVSFLLNGVHPHDIGTMLDTEGVAIRTGHHCAQPLMTRFGVPATARASIAVYNTKEDIDALIGALGKVKAIFQ